MNASNLLTMLSGSIGKENLGRLFQGEEKGTGDFAATLMTQIGALEQSGTKERPNKMFADLASLADQSFHRAGRGGEQMRSSMQEIAALLGNKLPAIGHLDHDIDLKKTLKTLNEVLEHIEGARDPLKASDRADWLGSARSAISNSLIKDKNVQARPIENTENSLETMLAFDADNKVLSHYSNPESSELTAEQDTRKAPMMPPSIINKRHQTLSSVDVNGNISPDELAFQAEEVFTENGNLPAAMMPLNIIKDSDETILAVDANIKLPSVEHSLEASDVDEKIPRLVKNLLQNGEELSNGKSLIEEQRLAGKDKPVTDEKKAIELTAKHDTKNPSTEKKVTPEAIVDKAAPKVALDMAQFHRQIAGQTKVEMPPMSKPMMHPEWDQELGERIVWMNNRALPFAELRLNPQHLGPISIRIDMNQDQATIAFSAQQTAVKEAIEAAIPKLREMMSAQQLNVAEINVTQASNEQAKLSGFSQAAQQQNEGGRKNGRGGHSFDNPDDADIAGEDADSVRQVVSSGILNIFA